MSASAVAGTRRFRARPIDSGVAGAAVAAAVPVNELRSAASSACENSPAVGHRSAGTRASAFCSTASTDCGTVGRSTRTDGASPVIIFAIIACVLGAVNGGSPASIS